MQFTTLTALLIAAIGVNAAPAFEKRVDSIPLALFNGTGCNSTPRPFTTENVPTTNTCFGISPIVRSPDESALIDDTVLKTLPAGCKLLVYSDFSCSSTNVLTYTSTGSCATFGPGVLIHSAQTQGTCA